MRYRIHYQTNDAGWQGYQPVDGIEEAVAEMRRLDKLTRDMFVRRHPTKITWAELSIRIEDR